MNQNSKPDQSINSDVAVGDDNVAQSNTQAATPHDETAPPLASKPDVFVNCTFSACEFADKYDNATDAATKKAALDKLIEKCAEIQQVIAKESAQIAIQRKTELLAEFNVMAIANGFANEQEMLKFAAYMPIPEATKVEPKTAADSGNAEKVHPNAKRKVFKELLIGNHDNYKRGHNGSFTGQKPHWCPIDPSGKGHDQTKFRLATEDEIAEMKALVAAELAAYKPRAKKTKDAGAPPKL